MSSVVYCGPAPLPIEIWGRWNLDPILLATLALLAIVIGRRPLGALAVAALFAAFVSPLCALSAALFSARVVHHVILIAVAAPLLALVWPARRTIGVTVPLLAFTAVLWVWHLPAAYDLALSNVAVYWAMQLSLLIAAIAFWRAVLDPGQATAPALLAVLASFVQMGMLGALLTLAPQSLYAAHALAPFDWGFTPLADQQLGGLIMWVPAGIPFAGWGALAARRGWHMAQGTAA